MLNFNCPWCGERAEVEFSCGGDADTLRPENWREVSDADWAAYLYMETNSRGVIRERWVHQFGCGEWFTVARNTLTNEIVDVFPTAKARPRSAVEI